VNFHTFPGARYEPFSFQDRDGSWAATVKPEYYGMWLFAQAAPPGSRLLAGSGTVAPGLDAWSLRSAGNVVHTVLVNYGQVSKMVALRLPSPGAPASVEWLTGPRLTATSGVTIGGQRFDAYGNLTGGRASTTVAAKRGAYTLKLPPASAALLTTPS
jgi:hypothetical protein